MPQTIEIVIKPQQLESVGKAWKGELSGLSPLRFTKEGLTMADPRSLVEAGITDSNGRILDKVLPAIEVLGKANAFTRVFLSNWSEVIFEYTCYHAPDGSTASIVNDAGDMKVSYPNANSDVLEGLRQKMGGSILRSLEFEKELGHHEALLLCALIDLQRKAFFRSLSSEQDIESVAVDREKLVAAASRDDGGDQWLVTILRKVQGTKGPIDADKATDGLGHLTDMGLIKKDGRFFTLSNEMMYLSRRFLIFDKFLTLARGTLKDGDRLDIASFTCAQAGVNDLLLIEAGPEKTHLEVLSSSAVLEYVRFFLGQIKEKETVRSLGGSLKRD